MYERYYSLSAMPFQLTPDGRFYFGSQEHKKAMAFLQYGVAQQEGFIVVTGEIGAGKTTLVEHLLSTLDSAEHVAGRVVTTQLGGFDMLCMISAAFGLNNEGLEKAALITQVTQFFAELQASGKRPLVIVDEAQSLSTEAIEELRMLSNLTTGGRALFQGILLGQPEFRQTLASPHLTQFRQRVIASCHLSALTAVEARQYIEYRLTKVGWANDPRFLDDAFKEIYDHTGGIPRRINLLCSRLLLLGYLEEKHEIDATAVANVAEELASELRPLSADRASEVLAQAPLPSGPNRTAQNGDALLSRIAELESIAARQDWLMVRVLDLALKYFARTER